jgi:hypothetical protein
MKNLVTGWGTPQAARYEKPALLSQIGSLAPEEQAAAVNGMNELYLAYPDQLNDLKSLTAADLKALSVVGADKQTGWMRLRNNLADEKKLRESTSIDDLVNILFDGKMNTADINTYLGEAGIAANMGSPHIDFSYLDGNKDGKVDQADLDTIRNKTMERVSPINSLSEIVAGNSKLAAPKSQSQSTLTPEQRTLHSVLTSGSKDGTFTQWDAARKIYGIVSPQARQGSKFTPTPQDVELLRAVVAQKQAPGTPSSNPREQYKWKGEWEYAWNLAKSALAEYDKKVSASPDKKKTGSGIQIDTTFASKAD